MTEKATHKILILWPCGCIEGWYEDTPIGQREFGVEAEIITRHGGRTERYETEEADEYIANRGTCPHVLPQAMFDELWQMRRLGNRRDPADYTNVPLPPSEQEPRS